MKLAPKVAMSLLLTLIPSFVVIGEGAIWGATTKNSMALAGIYDKKTVDVNKQIIGKTYPKIIAENQRIELNENYDPKTWAQVTDAYDTNLINKIEVYGTIDNTTKGDYEIRYVVRNRYGLKTTKKIRVIVD